MSDARVGWLCASVAAGAALWLGSVGSVWGTWAVGGSDSSCYALMAEAFAQGQLQPTSEWAHDAPWPSASTTLVPGGFVPSKVRPGGASPVCAPGFSLLLAPFRRVLGSEVIFLVTPVAAALLVWLTFAFAGELFGAVVGAASAVLVATSPVVIFQSVQPMNDVVTAMLWTAVGLACAGGVARRPIAIGALTGAAVLVRPNLAPVAAVVGLWVSLRRPRPGELGSSASAARFLLGLLPFVAIVAALNAALYGSPLSSGYGQTSELFSARHVWPNLVNYGRALVETQTLLPLLAVLAPLVCSRPRRLHCSMALGMIVAVVAVYLFYRPYPEWWYLRFLLPSLALATALATGALATLVAQVGGDKMRDAVLIALVSIVGVLGLNTASARQAFNLHALEHRFRLVGETVRSRLPPNIVAMTVWDSGSVRYHASRPVVLWDALDTGWLDRSLEWLRAQGHTPVIIIERWEEPSFRARFAGSTVGGLDWPPRFDIGGEVRIFDPSDRAPYFSGELIRTELIR